MRSKEFNEVQSSALCHHMFAMLSFFGNQQLSIDDSFSLSDIVPLAGDEILIPGKTNAAKTSVERSKTPNQKNVAGKTGVNGTDSIEGQERFYCPPQGASTWARSGSEADTNITGPGGLSDTPVVITSGEVETTKEDLQTDAEQVFNETRE